MCEFMTLEEEYEVKPDEVCPVPFSLPSGPCHFGGIKKRKQSDSPTAKTFDAEARNQLNCIIARMFYTEGKPFTLSRNPYCLEAFTYEANHNTFLNYHPNI